MDTETNKQSKSVLSRLLAAENITVMHKKEARTASFDVRNRVLVLPVLGNMSDELYDMIVGHEVGHALYTPFTEEDEKNIKQGKPITAAIEVGGEDFARTAMGYLNVIEDARIEKLMKEKFPGLRRDFYIGYQDLDNRDFFDLRGKNIPDMSFIDRINLHYKVGTFRHNFISFNDEEKTFINEIDEARTFDQVIAVTKKIWAYCKDKKRDENDPNDASTSVMGDDGNAYGDGTPGDEKGQGDANKGKSDYSNRGILPDECTTQASFNTHLSEMSEDTNEKYTYHTIPTLKRDVIVDYKKVMRYYIGYDEKHPDAYNQATKDYQEFANKSKLAVNILCKQFLAKKAARDSTRTSVNKTGVIDTVRMMNYNFNDDIFMRQTVVKKGKSHGLVFFMDWSGSMGICLGDTLKQLFQIVLFCKRMQIPYEVYAFTSRISEVHSYDDFEYSHNETDDNKAYGFHNFNLLNILSSRMNGTDFNTMMRNLFVQINSYSRRTSYSYSLPYQMELSSTPLNETIVAAMDIVPKFKENNNLDIVHTVFLTDGEASGCGIYPSHEYLKSHIVVGKKTYLIKQHTTTSDALYAAFRDITGCRSIGIYLDSRRRGGMSYNVLNRYFVDEKIIPKAKQTYDKEGFAVADPKCHGHDEMFIIQGNAEIDDEDLDEILSDKKSNVGIRNAFIKTMDNRMSSRIMLNRFIDLIAVE